MTITAERKERLAEQRRELTLDRVRGLPRGVAPRGAVVNHLQGLYNLGFSHGAIASAAGIGSSAPSYMLGQSQGRSQTYLKHARKYLALTPELIFATAADDTRVPSVGARRRYEALLWMGWRQQDIEAKALELTGHHAWCNMLNPPERIAASRHRAMAAVYDALHMTQGPSLLNQSRARNAGYASPWAWDEDTIDNPAVIAPIYTGRDRSDEIDDIAVERTLAGDWVPLTSKEIGEALRRGAERGMDCGEMATVLRMNKKAVQRRANRYGIHTTDRRLAA
jgi:hypothetical protein